MRKRTTNSHGVELFQSPNHLRQVVEWQEYTLLELPEDIDPGTRANVCSRVEAVLAAGFAIEEQPHTIRHAVDLAISQALVPYVRRKHRQEALRHAIGRLSCDGHAKERLMGPARRCIVTALAVVPENTGYADLRHSARGLA